MGKKEQLRRLRKEEARKALKDELRGRRRQRMEPYFRWGTFLGLSIAIIAVSSLIGWGAGNLYAVTRAKIAQMREVSGPFGTIARAELEGIRSATLKTSVGEITIELLPKESPQAVANFVLLARAGFYEGMKFHRTIDGFMIQTGDPNTKGDDVSLYGTGGPGYTFPDELSGDEQYLRGTVAMANSGPDTNGSQFFIVQKDQTEMPKSYTIFGQVTEGMEVVDKIATLPVKENSQGEKSLPRSPIVLEGVVINQ